MVGFLNTYVELLHFIEISYINNKFNQNITYLSFIHFVRLFMRNIQTDADTTTASRNLQEHFNTVENWLKKNGK